MSKRLRWVIALIMGALPLGAGAQSGSAGADADPGRVMVVYDSSRSMWGELSDRSRKFEAGRAALAAVLDRGLGEREIAFRAYGHRRADDCRDTELMTPFAPADRAVRAIDRAVRTIRPRGMTPITHSLREALKDFGGGAGDILLISDGVETCDADPCALMREWRAANVAIRVHVVGVGLSALERDALACIADESGGRYFDADSAASFEEALTDVGVEIEAAAAPEPPAPAENAPQEAGRGYAIVLRPTDAAGRRYTDVGGALYRDGALVDDRLVAQGRGRNRIEGPGLYEIEVGARLRDGSIYAPVRQTIRVDQPGDTIVDIAINAPARVAARFAESGAPHRGALISAFQDGVEIFRFRPQDEALAAPGEYTFRSEPNADNPLSVSATLNEGDLTVLEFELSQTVTAYVSFELPDGTVLRRQSELWRDGAPVYTLRGGNGGVVRPGVYELRSEDETLPFAPAEIVIGPEDGRTYVVPIAAGWVTVVYAPSDYGYLQRPDRAWLASVERGGRSYAQPDMPIPVAPGAYTVEGFDRAGFFADVARVDVRSGESVDAVLTPIELGEVVVDYAPSPSYAREPNRAFVRPLDGQPILRPTVTPGEPRRLLPGRYLIEGWRQAADVSPQEIVITAGRRHSVVLRPVGE